MPRQHQVRVPWGGFAISSAPRGISRGLQELHESTIQAGSQIYQAVIKHPLIAKTFKFSHLKGGLNPNCHINAAILYILYYDTYIYSVYIVLSYKHIFM